MSVKPIRAGELRHRITVQSKIPTRTPQGGFTLAWADVKTLWAKVSPVAGDEYWFSESVRAKMTHALVIRSQSSEYTTDMRALFGTRYLNFKEVKRVDEIRHETRIAAIEELGSTQNTPSTSASIPSQQVTYQTVEWDFTTTNTQDFTFPTGKRFFLDSVEVVVTELDGTVVTQPTITAGIAGNLTKFLNKLTTQLTADDVRQQYSGLGSNHGELELTIKQSVAGAVSALGTYKGLVILKGVLVG